MDSLRARAWLALVLCSGLSLAEAAPAPAPAGTPPAPVPGPAAPAAAAATPGGTTYVFPVEILNADMAIKREMRQACEKSVAANPKDVQARFLLGAVLCNLGAEGDEAAADACLQLFKQLNAEKPDDAEVRAFYGNACVVRANYVFFLFATSWADKGFAHLDAAVAAAPENVNVRLLRAINSAVVPEFLGRNKVGRADFDWLLEREKTHPREFSPEMRRTLYYYAGRLALRLGEPRCITLFVNALALPAPTPGDILAPRVTSLLERARAKFPAGKS